jgi:hypothetical protein
MSWSPLWILLQSIMKVVMLEKILKKSWSTGICARPTSKIPHENPKRLGNLIHIPPCKTPCRLSIHEIFFGPLGLHLRVWSELRRSPPFGSMRALRLQWSQAFSLVCEVTLSTHTFRNKFDLPFAQLLSYHCVFTQS